MCCVPLKPLNKCFRAATTKKKTIFHPKMAKKCQFLAQISIFWIRVVSLCPPLPILRVLDLKKKMFCMPIQPFHKCFRAATTKKTPFFTQKWPKNANF